MLPSPRRVITPCGSSLATRRLCAGPVVLESSGRVVDADQSTDTTLAELLSRLDVELPVHLAEVVVDGVGADEEARRDLGVGRPGGGEAGDLRLLRCEVVAGFVDALAGARAGREQLDSGPVGEAVGAHRLEDVVCRLELLRGRRGAVSVAGATRRRPAGCARACSFAPHASSSAIDSRIVSLGVGVARQQGFGRERGVRDRARSDWRWPVPPR